MCVNMKYQNRCIHRLRSTGFIYDLITDKKKHNKQTKTLKCNVNKNCQRDQLVLILFYWVLYLYSFCPQTLAGVQRQIVLIKCINVC